MFGQQLARYGMKMKSRFSLFDYTVTITRKQKYLIVGSPEFGFQVASHSLDLGQASPAQIGEAVMRVFDNINAKLHQLDLSGESHPEPLRAKGAHFLISRERVPIRDAAKMLGLSRSTLRRMARQNDIECERTPGGHLRFSLEALSDYLLKQQDGRYRHPLDVTASSGGSPDSVRTADGPRAA
jgi:excisionase family DNA binding protein